MMATPTMKTARPTTNAKPMTTAIASSDHITHELIMDMCCGDRKTARRKKEITDSIIHQVKKIDNKIGRSGDFIKKIRTTS